MFCLCVIAVNSSETLVMSTPVTERLQRHTADTVSRQTNPDDRKFVVRLKTLNLGASRKHQSSRGLVCCCYFPNYH